MSAFPRTDWIRLAALREGGAEEKQRVLGELFVRYREPVLAYLRGRGARNEQAEDLVQDFSCTPSSTGSSRRPTRRAAASATSC
jgi:hypothetical protein